MTMPYENVVDEDVAPCHFMNIEMLGSDNNKCCAEAEEKHLTFLSRKLSPNELQQKNPEMIKSLDEIID